jgi:hypothetical protein
MRPARLTATFTAGALGLALGAAMLATPARAGDDDTPIDTKILRSIMHGLGLKDGTEGSIDYQERAPLVIPPSKDLPPPQNDEAVIANNPAWPKDPDITRAKLRRKMEKENSGDSSERIDANSRPLLPSQLEPGGTASGPSRPRNADNASESGTGLSRLTPGELGSKDGLFSTLFGHSDDKSVKFTGEPPRVSLTDPPPGYQVPSPDQPYGLGKAAPAQAENSYITRGMVNENR